MRMGAEKLAYVMIPDESFGMTSFGYGDCLTVSFRLRASGAFDFVNRRVRDLLR